MEKRYQVFVSSTYADLKDERQAVMETLTRMDCIPAGMELFPAADEEQLAFIKRVIDDCDYYLLIIGGRYGTLTSEGISYTEQEYEYTVSKKLRVLAFVHQAPGDIPVSKSDTDPVLRNKLDAFRNRVSEGRLVEFWRAPTELPGLVALSLQHAIKAYPAVGWVRASNVPQEELLADLNELRKENAELKADLGGFGLELAEVDPRLLATVVRHQGEPIGDACVICATYSRSSRQFLFDVDFHHPVDLGLHTSLGFKVGLLLPRINMEVSAKPASRSTPNMGLQAFPDQSGRTLLLSDNLSLSLMAGDWGRITFSLGSKGPSKRRELDSGIRLFTDGGPVDVRFTLVLPDAK